MSLLLLNHFLESLKASLVYLLWKCVKCLNLACTIPPQSVTFLRYKHSYKIIWFLSQLFSQCFFVFVSTNFNLVFIPFWNSYGVWFQVYWCDLHHSLSSSGDNTQYFPASSMGSKTNTFATQYLCMHSFLDISLWRPCIPCQYRLR